MPRGLEGARRDHSISPLSGCQDVHQATNSSFTALSYSLLLLGPGCANNLDPIHHGAAYNALQEMAHAMAELGGMYLLWPD